MPASLFGEQPRVSIERQMLNAGCMLILPAQSRSAGTDTAIQVPARGNIMNGRQHLERLVPCIAGRRVKATETAIALR
jgi:hypothetical protein